MKLTTLIDSAAFNSIRKGNNVLFGKQHYLQTESNAPHQINLTLCDQTLPDLLGRAQIHEGGEIEVHVKTAAERLSPPF
jgi:hypothetical protein